MKKIFPLIVLLSSILLLSSCVIIETHNTYSITFENDTRHDIDDWYVEDRYGHNYVKSTDYVSIRRGGQSTIYDLHPADYRVRFSYYDDSYYFDSNYTYLNEDITFILSRNHFYSRNIAGIENRNEAEELILTDNKGRVYTITKAE